MLKVQDIEIEGMKFKIRELDTDSAFKLYKIDDRGEISKKMMEISIIEPEPNEKFFKELPARIGTKLMLKINELNGATEDFQKVPEVLPKKTNGK